jgi:hypothetical protein
MMSIAIGEADRETRDPILRGSGEAPELRPSSCMMMLRSWVLKRMRYSTTTMDLEISDRLEVIRLNQCLSSIA